MTKKIYRSRPIH